MKKMSVAAFILVVVSIAMTSAPNALAQGKWQAPARAGGGSGGL